jgi:hypothetical protein
VVVTMQSVDPKKTSSFFVLRGSLRLLLALVPLSHLMS